MDKNSLTVNEAAELSGYSIEYVRFLCRVGSVKSGKFGQQVVVDKESLLAYVESKKESST